MTNMVTTGQMLVNSTPAQIDGMNVSPMKLYIHNMDSTKTLFIGGPDVTILNGFAIDKSSIQNFTLFPNQGLYVVSDSGNHLISWMRIPV